MADQEPMLAVNGCQFGTVQQMDAAGITSCFILRASGIVTEDRTPGAWRLVIAPSDLPTFVRELVATARAEFPGTLADLPPV